MKGMEGLKRRIEDLENKLGASKKHFILELKGMESRTRSL